MTGSNDSIPASSSVTCPTNQGCGQNVVSKRAQRKRPAIGASTKHQQQRARKIYDDFVRRLQHAAEKANRRAYRKICFNFSQSQAAKFIALTRANKTLPPYARRTHQELFEIAKAINLFRRCAENAIRKLIPKDPDNADKGLREITRFGLINKARQIIVDDMIDPWARIVIQPNQYHLNGGRNTAVEDVLEKIRSGHRWATVFDVANFYPSVNLDEIATQLPIPTGILSRVCAASAYNYREHEQNSRLRSWAIDEFQEKYGIVNHIRGNRTTSGPQWACSNTRHRQRMLNPIISNDLQVEERAPYRHRAPGVGRSGINWLRRKPDGTARITEARDIPSIALEYLQFLSDAIATLRGRCVRHSLASNSVPATGDEPSRSGIPQGAKTSARLGEIALAPVIRAFPKAISFVDDGVIVAKTRREANASAETLRRLIGQCRNGRFCLKRCVVLSFARNGVEFLGYHIWTLYGRPGVWTRSVKIQSFPRRLYEKLTQGNPHGAIRRGRRFIVGFAQAYQLSPAAQNLKLIYLPVLSNWRAWAARQCFS